ncbi:MAG: carbon-nitrogen hydrolase family protein [Ardenticatenaceae bacterium]|nr:carbon-nitrogen hydrolase family protein [Ardenticatenaceae bacterium]
MLKVALLQMTSCGDDQAANQAKGEEFCRRAKDMGADIALFPELWNIGYTADDLRRPDAGDLWRAPTLWSGEEAPEPEHHEQARALWQAQAIGQDEAFVTHFRQLANELNLSIALTYLERWQGPPRNSMSLIDRHGNIVMTYAKVHTCDFDEPEASCTPGDEFRVCGLNTEAGEVKIGAMICYDREFPESARILMLKGAEIILCPNASTLVPLHICQFSVRAYENMVGVAMTNYAAPQNNGHSVAFSPVAFEVDGRARDTLIVEAGEHEGIYLAAFDLQQIREYRQRETGGNAFRRPHRYGLLTCLEIGDPFLRVNAAGESYDPTQR